jgi:hypothetical protein
VILCLQSTCTLSVTVAGLGLSLFLVCPGRPVSGLVVVRRGGQLGGAEEGWRPEARCDRQASSGSPDRPCEGRWCPNLIAKDDVGTGRLLDRWVPSDRGEIARRTNARKQKSGVARSIDNEQRGAVE